MIGALGRLRYDSALAPALTSLGKPRESVLVMRGVTQDERLFGGANR